MNKNSIGKRILLSVLVFILGGAIMAGVSFYLLKTKYEPQEETLTDKVAVLESVIQASTRNVYVAKEDLLPGMILTEDRVNIVAQYASGEYDLITSEDFGKIITQPVSAGHTVSRFALSANPEFDNNTRLVRFTEFTLTDKMIRGDYIDVRIRFDNGEDYIVLSKKRLNSLNDDLSACYLSLTEEELQMMASAITDASRYEALLYSTLYEEDMQDAVDKTYLPAFNNPELFPTVYSYQNKEKRKALEARLGGYTDDAFN